MPTKLDTVQFQLKLLVIRFVRLVRHTALKLVTNSLFLVERRIALGQSQVPRVDKSHLQIFSAIKY